MSLKFWPYIDGIEDCKLQSLCSPHALPSAQHGVKKCDGYIFLWEANFRLRCSLEHKSLQPRSSSAEVIGTRVLSASADEISNPFSLPFSHPCWPFPLAQLLFKSASRRRVRRMSAINDSHSGVVKVPFEELLWCCQRGFCSMVAPVRACVCSYWGDSPLKTPTGCSSLTLPCISSTPCLNKNNLSMLVKAKAQRTSF